MLDRLKCSNDRLEPIQKCFDIFVQNCLRNYLAPKVADHHNESKLAVLFHHHRWRIIHTRLRFSIKTLVSHEREFIIRFYVFSTCSRLSVSYQCLGAEQPSFTLLVAVARICLVPNYPGTLYGCFLLVKSAILHSRRAFTVMRYILVDRPSLAVQ